MLTLRLLVYLIMSLAYMVAAVTACRAIKERPTDNRPWLIAGPSLVLTILLLVVMVNDLLS